MSYVWLQELWEKPINMRKKSDFLTKWSKCIFRCTFNSWGHFAHLVFGSWEQWFNSWGTLCSLCHWLMGAMNHSQLLLQFPCNLRVWGWELKSSRAQEFESSQSRLWELNHPTNLNHCHCTLHSIPSQWCPNLTLPFYVNVILYEDSILFVIC